MEMGVLRPLRLPEALLVAGFTFVGTMFSASDGSSLLTVPAALFFLASYLVIVSIYAFNSWAGFAEDLANPRLALSPVVSRRLFAFVSGVTLAASCALFAVVAPRALWYALLVWLLWGIYSFPRRGTKYVPVAGTITHVFVGVVQFHQGWVWSGDPTGASFLLSFYFALLLAAGHLTHEAIDHEADRSAGLVSGAVRFGLKRWAWVHLAVALAALFVLFFAAFFRAVPFLRLVPFFAASLGHCVSAVKLVSSLDRDSFAFVRHRARYRLLFALAGVVSLAALLA